MAKVQNVQRFNRLSALEVIFCNELHDVTTITHYKNVNEGRNEQLECVLHAATRT